VPSTIISRCQLLEFKKLTDNQIAERIKYISNEEKIKIDDEAINEISTHCDGGLRDSIGLLEKVSSYQNDKIQKDDVRTVMGNISESEIEKFKDCFIKKDITNIISLVNEYYEMGIDLTKVVYDLINLLTKELFEKNINNSAMIMQLDSILSNMISSDNPKLILEVSLLNCLSDNSNQTDVNSSDDNSKISSKSDTKTQKKEDKGQQESKEPINIDVNNNDQKTNDFDIDNMKNIRVGNALSRAKKEIISNIRSNWKNISDLAFDSTYGNLARLLESDIVPVAASDEYVILNSKLAGLSEQINNDLNSVEKIFEIIFNNRYKVICITEDEWKNYTLEYKKDKSSFVYREETEKKGKKTLKEKAKELFDD
jgi:DNA polymerase III gamma/tau subunit